MKNKKLFLGIAAITAAAVLAGCGSIPKMEPQQEMESQLQQKVDEMEDKLSELLGVDAIDQESVPAAEEKNETEPSSEEAASEEDPEESGPPKSGGYEIDGIDVTYYTKVHNDKTGNWRLAVIYDGADLNSYAADFYKFFVTDDSEVFGIVNLGLKTSTLISPAMGDWLDISVMEYQDGEEHDANKLYSGMELQHYWLNMKTGETDYDLD